MSRRFRLWPFPEARLWERRRVALRRPSRRMQSGSLASSSSLPQERSVAIAAMDSDMARSAVAESRIRHVVRTRLERNAVVGSAEVAGSVVALEAERIDHRTFEQFRVRRPVR